MLPTDITVIETFGNSIAPTRFGKSGFKISDQTTVTGQRFAPSIIISQAKAFKHKVPRIHFSPRESTALMSNAIWSSTNHDSQTRHSKPWLE